MRKFKQVKRKEVIFDLDEWEIVERQAKKIQISTSDYIRRMAIKGQITILDLKKIGELMKALRIIGGTSIRLQKRQMKRTASMRTMWENYKRRSMRYSVP